MKRVQSFVALTTVLLVFGCAEPEEPASWEIDHLETTGALLSVWGTSPTDVWAVGGQANRGIVLHNDGTTWTPFDVDAGATLRWVYGFRADDVYAAGDNGLVLHYDGLTWQRVESGTNLTLYGLWGTSGDDVWIVGGDARGAAGSAVILRGNRRHLTHVDDLPPKLAPSALFKVYGGPQGAVAVGTDGTVLRHDGAVWTRDAVPTEHSIFSLWGRSHEDLYAVAGDGAGELLHFDGRRWSKINGDTTRRGLAGIFTAPDQPTIAVGTDSYIVELNRDGSEHEPILPLIDPIPSLHGIWGDSAGTTYAVGGDLLGDPRHMSGVIFRRSK